MDAAQIPPALAGGRAIDTPFGTFYTPNITPDEKTGIGAWTEDDFIRAMHEGIRADGSNAFPAFPYVFFNRVSVEDLKDIWAYLRAIPPVKRENKGNTLPFPMNVRFFQYGWKLLFFYFGYMALRSAIDDTAKADKASAVLALVGVINVIIVHYSVEWWSSLHQGQTLMAEGGPAMDPGMLYPLLAMIFGFNLLFGSLLLRRTRTEVLYRERRTRWVKEMILAPEGQN